MDLDNPHPPRSPVPAPAGFVIYLVALVGVILCWLFLG